MKIEVTHYMAFILSGILAWGFFSATMTNGLESIVGNYGLVSKVPIPLNVFALNESITLFINFLISQPILLLIMFFTNTPFTINLLYLPLLYSFLFLQGYSLALLLAILFVYFRDLRHLLVLLLQMLFYMTPIVYSLDMVPEKLLSYTYLVPHFYIFEGIHRVVARGMPMGMAELGVSATWTIGIFFSTMIIFFKTRHILAEKI
jgi:ABC-type polysaccharide/polyol phosphate export permease